MKKLFVGGVPYALTDADLAEIFAEYGTVVKANIVMDRELNRSKGFGFVEMSTDEEAAAAVQGLNNAEVDGRRIKVDPAKPKAK